MSSGRRQAVCPVQYMAQRLEPRNEPMHRRSKVLYSGSMVYGSPQDAAYGTTAEVQHAAHSLSGLGQVSCRHQPTKVSAAAAIGLTLTPLYGSHQFCFVAYMAISSSTLIYSRHQNSVYKPATAMLHTTQPCQLSPEQPRNLFCNLIKYCMMPLMCLGRS